MNPDDMTMTMGSAIPEWLDPVATAYIALSLVSALLIAADIYGRRHRHPAAVTELVWVTSGLYLGPLAVWWYARRGRVEHRGDRPAAATREGQTTSALLPGGSASAVAHLVAVPAVAALGWTIAGLAMWPMILVIAVLAIAMLAVYELLVSRVPAGEAGGLSVRAALLAAVVTVVAFDIGMVGWMLLLHYNDAMPAASEGAFWFLMQVGVVVGLATGYPAVSWLLRRRRTALPA